MGVKSRYTTANTNELGPKLSSNYSRNTLANRIQKDKLTMLNCSTETAGMYA